MVDGGWGMVGSGCVRMFKEMIGDETFASVCFL